MTRVKLARHSDQHRPVGTLGPDDPGGEDPIQIPPPGAVPATIAWLNALMENYTLEPTIGAGFGGSDFAALPIASSSSPQHAMAFSNAANNLDADHGFMPTGSSGDLRQAGFRIYSNHYPLTDWDYVSGDDISSLRIAEGYGGTYRMFLKALVSGDAAANQIIGFAVQSNGMIGARQGGWASTGGNSTWSVSTNNGATDIPALDDTTAFTDPGSAQFAQNGCVRADWQALLGMSGDDFADLVFFGWNPGPDDVTVNLGIEILKLDGSGQLFED